MLNAGFKNFILKVQVKVFFPLHKLGSVKNGEILYSVRILISIIYLCVGNVSQDLIINHGSCNFEPSKKIHLGFKLFNYF